MISFCIFQLFSIGLSSSHLMFLITEKETNKVKAKVSFHCSFVNIDEGITLQKNH